jgi:hypothetical protein
MVQIDVLQSTLSAIDWWTAIEIGTVVIGLVLESPEDENFHGLVQVGAGAFESCSTGTNAGIGV